MSTVTHSPVPWHVGPHYQHDIQSSVGRVAECCVLGSPLAIANAAFIVRACNSHEELLAACKELIVAVSSAMRVVSDLDAADLLGMSTDSRRKRLVDELHNSGVLDGFGVRAKACIAKAEAL